MTLAPSESRDAGSTGGPAPYRIMIVDDSAVVRGLMARSLEADPRIEVVASVSDGQMALNAVARRDIDVIILDIEMPVMDGLTALPKLIEAKPGVKIIVASTLTRRNAEISLRCLASGADDYIPKPSSARELGSADQFRTELLGKVIALGAAVHGEVEPQKRPEAAPAAARPAAAPRGPVALRDAPLQPPRAIAIGSSTGGPQALFALTKAIAPAANVPVFITQHMPPTFTTILAEHIGRTSGLPCSEGADGAIVEAGHIYVAPGDNHMTVRSGNGGVVISLNQDPPENFCRPSVDPMLRSLAHVYGPSLLVVILTGMGQDGRRGGEAVVGAGGAVIAQDEASSVVWGMPGAAAAAGICSAVLALDEMGGWITRILAGQGR